MLCLYGIGVWRQKKRLGKYVCLGNAGRCFCRRGMHRAHCELLSSLLKTGIIPCPEFLCACGTEKTKVSCLSERNVFFHDTEGIYERIAGTCAGKPGIFREKGIFRPTSGNCQGCRQGESYALPRQNTRPCGGIRLRQVYIGAYGYGAIGALFRRGASFMPSA